MIQVDKDLYNMGSVRGGGRSVRGEPDLYRPKPFSSRPASVYVDSSAGHSSSKKRRRLQDVESGSSKVPKKVKAESKISKALHKAAQALEDVAAAYRVKQDDADSTSSDSG